ncbi:MAG: hypothetical protein ACUVS4_06500, partial [Chloroflexaceae bacterium]
RTLAERQAGVAGLLAELHATRVMTAAAERDARARTLAERQAGVAGLLAELHATRVMTAAAERDARARTLAERQAGVAGLLAELHDRRVTMAAAERGRRQVEVASRRELVAGRTAIREGDDRRKPYAPATPASPPSLPRASRSSTVAKPRNGNTAVSVARTGASPLPHLGYAGLVAYAQMTRVAILRELERGEFGSEALQRHLEAHLESLQNNLQPLLDEVVALPPVDAPRKTQLLEAVEGARRSVETLSGDLGALPWPTAPEQQAAFAATIARLYDRLKPLQEHLESAAARLGPPAPSRARSNQRARPQGKARPAS